MNGQPGRSTNRDKYENKPMPPTPAKPAGGGVLSVPKQRGYIQPATPLVYSGYDSQGSKSRAATEPVVPKPLFGGGISQLRKKYPNAKTKLDVNAIEDNVKCMVEGPTPSPAISHKASPIVGMYPIHNNDRHTPPASAPPSTFTPDPYRMSSDNRPSRSISPSRQIQSTPVPTRRYLRENNLPTPPLTHTSTIASQQSGNVVHENTPNMGDTEGIIMGDDTFKPTRTGTYGRVGEVAYVEGHEKQRVASYSGVIEEAEPIADTEGRKDPSSASTTWTTDKSGLSSGGLLPPAAYSPSNYGGIWENDPHVVSQAISNSEAIMTDLQGYSLPQFSPVPPNYHQSSDVQMRDSSQGSGSVVPLVLRDYNGQPSHLAKPPPSFSSTVSWAANSRASLGNSYAIPPPHLSPSTGVPPYPSSHGANNSVPTPPRSYPGFQPSGQIPNGLAHLELTLHHHIESCFGSLSRLTVDRHDRAMDQTIRRLDNLQEMVAKGLKSAKADGKDIRKEIGNLSMEFKENIKGSEEIRDLVKGLGEKIGKIEKQVEEGGCKCQHTAAEASGSDPEVPGGQQGNLANPRTSGSHGTSGQQERRQQYRSGASQSSSRRHQSQNSSRGRQSNGMSAGTGGGRSSGAGSARREYFAELGATRGPMPDLREHPAYSGAQQVQQGYNGQAFDENGVPVEMGLPNDTIFPPSFSEGWYQRVYGH